MPTGNIKTVADAAKALADAYDKLDAMTRTRLSLLSQLQQITGDMALLQSDIVQKTADLKAAVQGLT